MVDFSLPEVAKFKTLVTGALVVAHLAVLYYYVRADRGKDEEEEEGDESKCDDDVELQPVPTVHSLEEVYRDDEVESQSRRYDAMHTLFQSKFGREPDFIVRSPGRVNLIGEHQDYCGYGVFPMALSKDTLFAVALHRDHGDSPTHVAKLGNKDPHFADASLDLSKAESVVSSSAWPKYFAAAVLGCEETLGFKMRFGGMDVLVHGNVPQGGGLSSSASFVCGSILSLLKAATLSTVAPAIFDDRKKEAAAQLLRDSLRISKTAMDCETLVGVDAGGMDQTVCMMAEKGFAKYIEFTPCIRPKSVPLPPITPSLRYAFVICNTLATHTLTDASDARSFNARVVEVRLAAICLAKALSLPNWQKMRTLRQVEDVYFQELSADLPDDQRIERLEKMLFLVMDNMAEDPLKVEGILELLELGVEDLEGLFKGLRMGFTVATRLMENRKDLFVRHRATHVYSEALRVLQFKDVCHNSDLRAMAALMNESHASCRDNYDCSSDELETLRKVCLDAGALASRLTGAGWGGCTVSLVPNTERGSVGKFMAAVKRGYYASFDEVPMDAVFRTMPAPSALFVDM